MTRLAFVVIAVFRWGENQELFGEFGGARERVGAEFDGGFVGKVAA